MKTFSPVRKSWKLAPPSPYVKHLVKEARVTPIQARLLANRGLTDINAVYSFLNPRLSQMIDPMTMKGMKDAVMTVSRAVEEKKRVTVYGDYDADGLTATALLASFLSHLGAEVDTYVPDRIIEGYGLNEMAIKRVREAGTELIITVDCGISNKNEVILAKSLGMDVVITDHHQIPPGFNMPCPVVNPHQPQCSFPFKELSGAGLAFYLAVALRAALRKSGWFSFRDEPDLKDYLDLAALGTIADRVPLTEQNRMLAYFGVARMAYSIWPGIRALIAVSNIDPDKVSGEDVAFKMAPRINAPGRIGDSSMGLNILMAENSFEADVLAGKLDAMNSMRQTLEQGVFEEAAAMVDAQMLDRHTILLGSEKWQRGILGIVASRLVERYHRPVMMAAIQNGFAVGSGRSIDGFDLYENMKQMSQYFEKFGGHYHAAGFTLRAGRLKDFQEVFERAAERQLQTENLTPSIHIDAELPLDEVSLDVLDQIKGLAPFGEGNPVPVFMARSVNILDSRIVGERHLKLKIGQRGMVFEAIGFNLADRRPCKGLALDLLFTPEINHWHGNETVQLRIIDLAQ